MKKIILPIIAAILLFAGCREKAHIVTNYYTVSADQWYATPDDSQNPDYIYSSWYNVDITPEVINEGVVLAYFIDEDGRDNLLPYTIYHIDDNGIPYQERIEYDVEFNQHEGCGMITFKMKATDFQILQTLTNMGDMLFKVSVISNY